MPLGFPIGGCLPLLLSLLGFPIGGCLPLVADNVFLGREKTWGGRLGWLDNRAMAARAKSLFERLGTPISPQARLADLRVGDQQMVEIAKALAFDAEIVIMDDRVGRR